MKLVILHNRVEKYTGEDDIDILFQADAVAKALEEIGHESISIDFTLDIIDLMNRLGQAQPDLVFNLADSLQGEGELIHFAPTVLEYMHVPYTGCPAESIFLTSNKVLAKRVMRLCDIPTPDWVTVDKLSDPPVRTSTRFVLKSIWEHASAGLDIASVVQVEERGELAELLRRKRGGVFAEQYIEGREFNLSLLDGKGETEVLAPAEMRFFDFPEGMPKILGYEAKWNQRSEVYRNTRRSFDFGGEDGPLLGKLTNISKKCWNIFKLNGYARVDFRVDDNGNPYVLEINSNPCISPESGYVAAAERSGIDYTHMIERIIDRPVGEWE